MHHHQSQLNVRNASKPRISSLEDTLTLSYFPTTPRRDCCFTSQFLQHPITHGERRPREQTMQCNASTAAQDELHDDAATSHRPTSSNLLIVTLLLFSLHSRGRAANLLLEPKFSGDATIFTLTSLSTHLSLPSIP